MPERKHDITVKLVWNEHGVPVVPISPDAHVTLSVDTSDSKLAADSSLPPQSSTVAIHGNRAGLIALAEQILAIAHTDCEGFHQHFDDEFPANFLDADGGWELLVGRNDNRAIRKAITNG